MLYITANTLGDARSSSDWESKSVIRVAMHINMAVAQGMFECHVHL